MRNKYLLGGGALLGIFIFLAFSPLTHGAIGSLEDAWKAITKLQTDLKNVQFTSGLPGPKTIEFAKNTQVVSSPHVTRWYEVSGGYNRITFDVKKTQGADSLSLHNLQIEFTNNPSESIPLAEQVSIDCEKTKCPLQVLPMLAKFYRIKLNADQGLRFSAYAYVSTEGLPGPKGESGSGGGSSNSEIQALKDQINSLNSRITKLEGQPNPPPPPATGIVATLSSNNPASMVLAGGSANNLVTRLTLTNNTNTNVNLTQVTLTRGGIVQDSYIIGVGIYDSSGKRHGNIGTFGNTKSTIGFANDSILVPANSSVNLSIKINLASSITTGTVNIGVTQGTELILSTGSINGTFPIIGNTHTIVSGSNVIGSATLTSQTVGGGTAGSPQIIDFNAVNLDVQKFRITETSGQEDLKLNSLLITNMGNSNDGDYTNIKLRDALGNTLATTSQSVLGKVYYTLANPYIIPRGASRDFLLTIDIPSAQLNPPRTIDFTVQNDYDVELYGTQTNSGVLPTSAGSSTFPIGDGSGADVGNYIQIGNGTVANPTSKLTVSKSSDSPSEKMTSGAAQQTLASFDVKAEGGDFELQKLTFVVTKDGTNELITGMHSFTGSIKINDENGATLFSASANQSLLYSADGTFNISNNTITNAGAGAATGTQVTLNTFKTISAGTTSKLNFVVDLSTNATSNDQYAIAVQGYYARRASSNSFTTNTSTVTGNVRQVANSSLKVVINPLYTPSNLIKGSSGAKIGSYYIQAGSAENVTLTSLGLIICTNNSSSTDKTICDNGALPEGITNLNVKVNGSSFGSVIPSSPPGVTRIFSGNSPVQASDTVTVDIFADISNSFDPNSIGGDFIATQLGVISSYGQISQLNITVPNVTGQTINIVGNGALKLEADAAGTPIQQIVRSSQTAVPLMTFKLSDTLNAEDLIVRRLYFQVTKGAGNYSNLALYDGSTQIGSNANIINGEIRFNNLSLNIAKAASPRIPTLKGDSTNSGTQIVGSKTKFSPTFHEYQGASSGTTVRVSGGVIAIIASSAVQTVNDGAQFKIGDKVAIDLDNDGNISESSETNSGAGYGIVSISGNTITLDSSISTTAIGGKVISYDNASSGASVGSRLNFSSSTFINHNSEPVVAVDTSASTGSNGSSNQPIATFNITAGGSRDITIHALQFKFTGSFVGSGAMSSSCASTGGIYTVQVWKNGLNQTGTLYRATTAGTGATCFASGESGSFLFTNPITISAGTTVPFVVKANTSLTRFGLSTSGTISYGVYLDGVAGKGQLSGGGTATDTAQTLGGVFWDYNDVNGRYGSTGNTTPGTLPVFTTVNATNGEVMDVTDYYPVNGPVINY